MLSSPLPLWRLALALFLSLSTLFPAVQAFHNETLGGVQFSSTGGFTAKGTFTCILDNVIYNIQSTTTIGAVVNAEFQGTAVYLLALVDSIDRGLYDISVDGGAATSVAGTGPARQCAYIYSKTGLTYGDHKISVNNAHANPNNATFTKFEFLAFVVTVPDAADITTTSQQPATSSSVSIPNSGPTNTSSNSNLATSNQSLSAGAVAGIAIGIVAVVAILVVLLVIYFHRKNANRRYSTTQSFYGVAPGGPGGRPGGGGPAEITPYTGGYNSPAPFVSYGGGAEVMTMPANNQSLSTMHTGQGYGPQGHNGNWAAAAAGLPPGRLSEADIDRIAQRMATMNAQGGLGMQQPVFQQMSNPHLRQMLEQQQTGGSSPSPVHVPVPQRPPPEPSRYPPEKVPRTPAPNYDSPYR